jgi:hypothetical protein
MAGEHGAKPTSREERMKLARHHNRPDADSSAYHTDFSRGILGNTSGFFAEALYAGFKVEHPGYFHTWELLRETMEQKLGQDYNPANCSKLIKDGSVQDLVQKIRQYPMDVNQAAIVMPREILDAIYSTN